jgi:glycosyl transferase family 87
MTPNEISALASRFHRVQHALFPQTLRWGRSGRRGGDRLPVNDGVTRPSLKGGRAWTRKDRLTALLMAPIIWLEPVRLTLQLGQINLVIMAIVVADSLSSRRWTGMAIGIAAGIKLTPALFIVFLAATGRRREAVIAGLTFISTIAVGFVLLPADSSEFWLRGRFHDVRRISSDPLANASLTGLLARLDWATRWETATAVVFAIFAIAVAALAWRRGQMLLAVAIAGMTSAAASPFSWSHHWVWFAPFLVHLGLLGFVYRSRVATLAMWTLAAKRSSTGRSAVRAPPGDVGPASSGGLPFRTLYRAHLQCVHNLADTTAPSGRNDRH